jgi:hypothetical protein
MLILCWITEAKDTLRNCNIGFSMVTIVIQTSGEPTNFFSGDGMGSTTSVGDRGN